jgi:hypothetical protein
MPVLLGFTTERVTDFAVKGLAVAGAFVVGLALVGLIVYLLDHSLFGKKTPPLLKRVTRITGGLAAAILAALWLFGNGGGTGGGSGNATGPAEGASPTATSPTSITVPALTPTPPPPDADAFLRITVLGGSDVMGEKFYKVDDDAVPKSIGEIDTIYKSRKMPDKKFAIVLILGDRTDPDGFGVGQLRSWARRTGLGIHEPAKP